MNVRFFYDDTQLEFISFNNFKDGYGSMSPNPPSINKGSNTSGVQLFGFPMLLHTLMALFNC